MIAARNNGLMIWMESFFIEFISWLKICFSINRVAMVMNIAISIVSNSLILGYGRWKYAMIFEIVVSVKNVVKDDRLSIRDCFDLVWSL